VIEKLLAPSIRINRKEAQIYNKVTFYCGFNKEIDWIEGIIKENSWSDKDLRP